MSTRTVDVERMRRYRQRTTAAAHDCARARWLASLMFEHRAIHECHAPCSTCVDTFVTDHYNLHIPLLHYNAEQLGQLLGQPVATWPALASSPWTQQP